MAPLPPSGAIACLGFPTIDDAETMAHLRRLEEAAMSVAIVDMIPRSTSFALSRRQFDAP